jgi:serine/threonine-protein kinase PpkA
MEIPGYEIKRQIGQGGMAIAYLAEQKSLGRQVVLKILDNKVRDTPETTERFLNEGRIIASLNHPHIITIFDIGQSNDDVYISMEYVEGGDLRERMQHKVFAPVEAIDVIEKIAGGLAVAHQNGIVHRDVKPGNILFRRDGTPLLSDFGIAKRLSGDSDLTSTGMFLGSPNYMAPEQSEAGPIDGRADIYSLGIIFFEMMSGERAYTGESVIDVIVMHKTAPIPTLRTGFEEYQELLNLMLAKKRNDRFRDAESLLHFIAEMRKSGTIKSKAEMTASPDIDLTGEHAVVGEVPEPAVRRTKLEQRQLPVAKLAMIGMLIVCALGWGVLIIIERKMQ